LNALSLTVDEGWPWPFLVGLLALNIGMLHRASNFE